MINWNKIEKEMPPYVKGKSYLLQTSTEIPDFEIANCVGGYFCIGTTTIGPTSTWRWYDFVAWAYITPLSKESEQMLEEGIQAVKDDKVSRLVPKELEDD